MSEPENITWADIENAASKMFRVWTDGGELEWAREAWQYLGEKGLTNGSTIIERTKTHLRLVSLARIYEEFCGVAWDENPETPIDYLVENLQIDPVALGFIAAAAEPGQFEDIRNHYELRETALFAVTNWLRREIFGCLQNAYGDPVRLYSRMWHTSNDFSEEGAEFDVTEQNSSALEYVMMGFEKG